MFGTVCFLDPFQWNGTETVLCPETSSYERHPGAVSSTPNHRGSHHRHIVSVIKKTPHCGLQRARQIWKIKRKSTVPSFGYKFILILRKLGIIIILYCTSNFSKLLCCLCHIKTSGLQNILQVARHGSIQWQGEGTI